MREVFSWPGVLVFFQPIGALVWMFCLYKCGLTFKLAGETILGYFLVGYFIPPNLFVHSIVGRNWLGRAQGCDVPSDDWVNLDDWLEPCRDNAYGYPIQERRCTQYGNMHGHVYRQVHVPVKRHTCKNICICIWFRWSGWMLVARQPSSAVCSSTRPNLKM